MREDSELTGVGTEPWLAIGQRALLVPLGERFVHVGLHDAASTTRPPTRSSAAAACAAIAISHPHYYSGMADWAARFDCPVLLHADDERWITRPDPAIELWDGETRELGDGLTLDPSAAGTSRAAPCCTGATARAAPARC